MAKEPHPARKPDDEEPAKDDLLSDASLEELDLDSIIEDDTPTAREVPGARPPESAVEEPSLLDDGDIDLLSDDILGGAGGDVKGSVTGPETSTDPEASRMDLSSGATNGRTPADVLAGEAGTDAVDDAEEIDLLADDLLADSPLPASGPEEAKEHVSKPTPAATGPAGGTSDDEKAALLADDASPEEAKAAGETARPARRLARGLKKPKKDEKEPGRGAKRAFGKKEKATGDLKKKPEKASRAVSQEKVPVAAAVKVRGSVAFVCSECYEEFLLPVNYSREMVSCPECLHVGKRPDEDFLRTVNTHKGGEKKSFALAIGAGVLLLAIVLALLWIVSLPYTLDHSGTPDQTIVLALLGGSLIVGALFIWLVVRFEGNRWEVYF